MAKMTKTSLAVILTTVSLTSAAILPSQEYGKFIYRSVSFDVGDSVLCICSKCVFLSLINTIDTKIRPLPNTEIWQMRSSAICGKHTRVCCNLL